jgi:hypothetical protein
VVLVLLLVGPPVPAGPLQGSASNPVAPGAPECTAGNRSPLIEAILEPGSAVTGATIYYRSAGASSFSSVEMQRNGDRLDACLPPPDGETLTYYVVTTGGPGPEQRTPEIKVVVVPDPALCGGRRMPRYCDSPAAGAAPSSAPANFATGAGKGGVNTAIIVASGAALAGLGIFLLVQDEEPRSGSR